MKFQNIILVAFFSAGSLFASGKNSLEIDLATARIEIADKNILRTSLPPENWKSILP